MVARTLQSGGLFDRLSVRANLDLPRRWHRIGPGDGLPDIAWPAAASAGELAYGTARLVEIAAPPASTPR